MMSRLQATYAASGVAKGQPVAVISVAVFILSVAAAATQQSATSSLYTGDDAYQVYSVLLPKQESYGFARGTLVIQQDTVSAPGVESCLTPEATNRFKDAIADYERVNRKPWLLQRKLHVEKDYEIVNADTIKVAFKKDGWEAFYKRYPRSGGYLTMSAVGFNNDKTLAVVHTGSSCGLLCGSWGFNLLEKVDGKWRQVPGVTCAGAS